MRRALLGLVVIFLSLGGESHAAPAMFERANYTAMVSSGSSETIEPGTQITLGNWQHYKRYLPFGIQVLYSGQYLWHVGSTADFTITVGPAIDYEWPRQYLEDTEKYGDQTRLEKVEGGGYAIANYVAGLPFPIPAQPNLADKVDYNLRYGPSPTVFWWPWISLAIDRFLNVRTTSEGTFEFYRLSHLSTPGVPINPDYGKGYLNSQRSDVSAPEDIKYTVLMTLQPDDPTALSEQYIYVPQIRRSLRSTTVGRCTYQAGIDSSTRDFTSDVANSRASLLGEVKILALAHSTKDPAVLYSLTGFHLKSSLSGWPTPALGRWEVRNVYVIDYAPLPTNLASKCFSHSVIYVDQDSWAYMGGEDYDVEGKLWKEYINANMELPDKSQGGDYIIGHHGVTLNLKENHVTVVTLASAPKLDGDVPVEYRNAADSALPGSLLTINK
ncbi:MAG TPA: DUF1329 domain-containing protein [Candidatus Binataceae bacterium]|nr:DUF1329 domain-containing protein [Candidatus Binataceae bacterium]